jgi:4-amino-4-deoxy-L-arabinose transferase-like glycosyltransferase
MSSQIAAPTAVILRPASFRLNELARRLAIPAALAAITATLYLVNLTVSGWANTYYALAAQAGSQSWSAWFFGALDSSGFITIDKPPLATWLIGLSVRVFGLSSWSILVPQALLGVASVLVLHATVRRSFGNAAAAIAGLLFATMPVAALIFRYDNPDALLTFLLVAAAWALGRGLEAGRLRWALLAAALVGTAFLTKFLQAYLVLPAFALVWLVSAPVSLRRRIGGLVASAFVVALSSSWWVAIVELLPASARPYIGGSTNNSVLDLILGYDGLGRIFGSGGSGLSSAIDGASGGIGAGGGPGGSPFGGDPGLLRLFNAEFGGQIAWLLPVAIAAIGVAVVLHRRARRTDARVAGYLLWGTWLAVHAIVFSLMSGIIHPYYTVILAPAVAALAGAVAVDLWTRREAALARAAMAALVAGSGVVAWLLLDRTPSFAPGLGIAIAAIAGLAAVLLALPARADVAGGRRLAPIGAALALAAVLAGPLAYDATTIGSALSGGDPAAGPAVTDTRGFGPGPGDGGPGGGPGGTAVGDATLEYLLANQGSARWIVAVSGAGSAAGIQLTTGAPVMTMGGFTGSDPTPTLTELQKYVAAGDLRFVLLGLGGRGGFGGPGDGGFGGGDGASGGGGFDGGPDGAFGGTGGPAGQGTSRAVSAWVTSSCVAVSIDGATVAGLYDCAGAA